MTTDKRNQMKTGASAKPSGSGNASVETAKSGAGAPAHVSKHMGAHHMPLRGPGTKHGEQIHTTGGHPTNVRKQHAKAPQDPRHAKLTFNTRGGKKKAKRYA